jgi:hypothetical protein
MTEPSANTGQSEPPPDGPEKPPPRPPVEFDTVFKHHPPDNVETRESR